MELTWQGTASLILKENDTVIAFDPFCGIEEPTSLSKKRPPILQKHTQLQAFRTAQTIFITHGHFDHIYHFPRIYHNLPVDIYCTPTPAKTLLRHGINASSIRLIQPGATQLIGPFTVTAYKSRHCKFDKPLLKKTILSRRFWRYPHHLIRLLALNICYPENKEILFYEVTCRHKRIQIMGSMNLDPLTAYPTGADCLILPLQGRSDQDEYALQFVERLKPKAILLDHYDNTFPPISGDIDPSGFIRNVRERFGIPCRPLMKGEIIYDVIDATELIKHIFSNPQLLEQPLNEPSGFDYK